MQPDHWDKIKDPLTLADALWCQEAAELAPDRFRVLFERAYTAAPDIFCMWQLGGALNDYLRHNPAALEIPSDLPDRLLASDDVEARVIGLKLLAASDASDKEIARESIRAIARQDEYESYGGLWQIFALVDDPVRCANLNVEVRTQIRNSLALCLQDDDQYTRDTAAQCLELMSDVC